MIVRPYPHRGSSRAHGLFPWMMLLFLFSLTTTTASTDQLGPDSVIVITGAAGFIGSQLALALHRTYQPKKIIAIDSMDKGFGTSHNDDENTNQRTDQDLALFEFKRQRVFYLLQEAATTVHFYRADLRPSIPEYFDSGEVPILARIFEQNPDITHVVHLADHYHWGTLKQKDMDVRKFQVVPRVKGQPKAGLMEAILEQLVLFQNKHGRLPHFTYASSFEVYKHAHNMTTTDAFGGDPRLPPFIEESAVTTPSSISGASKLLDEVLAQTYHDLQDIFSIGLRFFSVYGPWSLPGSPLFEMAERMVAGESPLMETHGEGSTSAMDSLDDIRDFVYIDDAVNAVMAAMQFRPTTTTANAQPKPVVINVGSGLGTTLRKIAKEMESFFPGIHSIDGAARTPDTISFASTARAQQLLGYTPQTPLNEGVEKLLAWHYDRAFPYGAKPSTTGAAASLSKALIAKKGMVACNKYDSECLKGTPVFPCASECAHESQCISSFWDDVMEYTKALTFGCHTVMYTVALDENLSLLPSTVVKVSENSKPFVEENGNCNVAFVSESSILYQKLSRSGSNVVQHGFWSLIPVHISDYARQDLHVLGLLPKLSPSQFFSMSARHGIYCDPDLIFHSIPKLLHEASMQPFNTDQIKGTTALLIGKRSPHDVQASRFNMTRAADQVQENAYRMIRIALIEEMAGDGFAQLVDSSFLVHTLASEDARLFRCDVYGEVVQWDASTDRSALEFTMGLHDLWSRVITKKMGFEPWWIGNDVRTVDQDGNFVHRPQQQQQQQQDRRLEEEDEDDEKQAEEEQGDQESEEDDGAADDAIVPDAEHTGFGLQEAARLVFGDRMQQQRYETPHDDDFDLGDDWTKQVEGGEILPVLPKPPKDPSTYDVWMGILSSSTVRSFGRIVTMEAVGAMHIDNYEELAYA